MSTKLDLGAGTDDREGYTTVDAVARTNPDVLHDLNEYPWPFDDNSAERIRASHVLEHLVDVDAALAECARILRPSGVLDTRWPVRANYAADDTHKHEWTWKTPANKLRDHWQPDFPLTLRHRDVELHARAPGRLGPLQRRKFDVLMMLYGPGEWCWRPPGPTLGPYGGEFRVVFEHG